MPDHNTYDIVYIRPMNLHKYFGIVPVPTKAIVLDTRSLLEKKKDFMHIHKKAKI